MKTKLLNKIILKCLEVEWYDLQYLLQNYPEASKRTKTQKKGGCGGGRWADGRSMAKPG